MSQGQLVCYALVTAFAAGVLVGHWMGRLYFAMQRKQLQRESDEARALWTSLNRLF